MATHCENALALRYPDPVSLINPSFHRFDRLRIGRTDDEFVRGGRPLFGLAPAEALTLEFFHPGSYGGEIVGSAHRDFLPSVYGVNARYRAWFRRLGRDLPFKIVVAG
jgi:hypothetical protein